MPSPILISPGRAAAYGRGGGPVAASGRVVCSGTRSGGRSDALAVPHVGIRLAPAAAARRLDGPLGRRPANGPLELAGPEPVPEPGGADGHLHQPERAAVAVRQNRLGPVLGDDLRPPVGDLG